MFSEVLVQPSVRYARLHPGYEVPGADLQDLVHQAEVEADAAPGRDGVPLQAAPLAEGDHGHAVFVGEAQDLDYLLAVLRVDHGVGGTRRVVGEDGATVTLDLLPFGHDAVLG